MPAQPPSQTELTDARQAHFAWLQEKCPEKNLTEECHVHNHTFDDVPLNLIVAESLRIMLLTEDVRFLTALNNARNSANEAVTLLSALAAEMALVEAEAIRLASEDKTTMLGQMLGISNRGQRLLHDILEAEQIISRHGQHRRITGIAEWKKHRTSVRVALVKAFIPPEIAYDLFPQPEQKKSTKDANLSELRGHLPERN